MIDRNYNRTIDNLLGSFAAAFSILVALTLNFKMNGTLVALLTLGISIVSFCFLKKIRVTIYDACLFCALMLSLLHRNEEYALFNGVYVLLAWMAFYLVRTRRKLYTVMRVIAIFSLVNAFVNVINIISPSAYFKLIGILLKPEAVESAQYYYRNNGFLSGLSDHYSRNAYWCIAGGSVFAAVFFAKEKHRKLSLVALIAELLLIMVIGKRGHLIFFAMALLFTYLVMEPNLPKRISRILKIILVVGILGAVILEMVPAVSFVFERFAQQIAGGDISTGRFELWSKAWNLFKEKPLFGWGYGYFSTHTMNTTLNVMFAGVHNDYLQWLCELGVVGFAFNFIAIVGIFLFTLKLLNYTVRHYKNHTQYKLMLSWSVLFQTFVILYSLTGLPHYDFEVNYIYYISMSVPFMVYSTGDFSGVKMRRIALKWHMIK